MEFTTSSSENGLIEIEDVPGDHVINQAAFSADGHWLCVWAIGGSVDLCCYWNVDVFPPTLYGKTYLEKVFTLFSFLSQKC